MEIFDKELEKISLLERFLLLFKRKRIGFDHSMNSDYNIIIYTKRLWNKIYIVKEEIYDRRGKIIKRS